MADETNLRDILKRQEDIEAEQRRLDFNQFILRVEMTKADLLATEKADATIFVEGAETGRILIMNPKASQMFGYEPYEIRGQPIEILIAPELRDTHRQHRLDYLKNPEPRSMGRGMKMALRGYGKSHNYFPIAISLNPLFVDGRLVVYLHCTALDE